MHNSHMWVRFPHNKNTRAWEATHEIRLETVENVWYNRKITLEMVEND